MVYLTAALVLVGAVSAVNLVLVMGILQRLRQTAAAPRPRGQQSPPTLLPAGKMPAPFDAVTDEGEPVSRESVLGGLVGFFTPQCGACRERMPDFLAYAVRGGFDRSQVLAVLIGEPDEVTEMRAELAPVARIVREPHGGAAVHKAFEVYGLPAYCLLDRDGAVVASGSEMIDFPALEGSGTGRGR
ncbi:TlpA disulfide reductase family protein [Dactylosporangium sp. CA-139066]|uniref:TlpA disulfide reductase family protein n=1 Tax=Dactylosporangium sp. CA-139066 TaxID=3239930 RepID=UPI003D8D29FE